MGLSELPPLDGPGSNANNFVTWLRGRPEEDLISSAQALFEKILDIASQPRNATKDACVKLCGLVQLCAKSEQEPLRQWAFRQQTVKDLFNYYLEWNEKDQHRSMRLAIDLVSLLILQNPDSRVRESLKTEFLSTLVAVISKHSTRPVVKSCISALTHFLTKSVLTLDDLAQEYGSIRPELTGETFPSTLSLWEDWTTLLFKWMELHYMCPIAGKLLVTIWSTLHSGITTDGERTNTTDFDVGNVRNWLETALSTNPDILESVKNYVLTPMFKSDRGLSVALLEELNKGEHVHDTGSSGEDVTALLHLAALEVGKKSSIVDDPGPTGAKTAANIVIIDRKIIERFLVHTSHEVRSFAVSLLITSTSSTKPYSPMAFELLRRHLRSCHADPDAKFRNEILAHSRNMVKRIQGAMLVLRKDIGRLAMKTNKAAANGSPVNTHISQGAKHIANAGESWLRDSLKTHEDFFTWYLNFLRQELVPTASYPRHITALKSLVNILKSEGESSGAGGQLLCQDAQWMRILVDLIMDPFDDVRETATGLLMLYPAEATRKEIVYGIGQLRTTPLNILTEFCIRAADLASRTSRADHSDGAARSVGLLCAWQETVDDRLALVSRTLDELEQKIAMAEKDLGSAIMSVPVHGTFAAIRYMWEVLSQSHYSADELYLFAGPQFRMVDLCMRIWNAVSYVLCDDSPEGHLPEELEEIEGLDTKGLLSYSFRAIHESSNLMRIIVGNLRFSGVVGSLLPSAEVFRAAGNLAFSQLSTLRHRGAFSSVSLTFTCCCQHAQNSAVASSADERPLLEAWYEGTLSCIHSQRSTTRRSAGIPSLMTGILTSNARSPSFQTVLRTLQNIAATPARVTETDGSNLPQVHAFNCIKEVFKSSLLSKHAEAYLAECLQLATGSLKSEVWAIRNCALLLLHALINTLFGSTESKASLESGWDGKTLRLSYTKYAILPPILLNLLQSGEQAMEPGTLAQSSAAESVFPALEIIRRAGPPESHRDELYRLISKYLGSRQWHVREIAARTLCSFLMSGDWLAAIRGLLQESRGSVNRLHGALLTIKFFLERQLLEIKLDESDMESLERSFDDLQDEALKCSETAALFVEARGLLWQTIPPWESPSKQRSLVSDINRRRGTTPFTSAALLNNRIGLVTLRQEAAACIAAHYPEAASERWDTSERLGAFKVYLLQVLRDDVDTGCALLEYSPTFWKQCHETELCGLYLEVCKQTSVPEARAVALTNLAELMSECIAKSQVQDIPRPEELDAFQYSLQDTINPTLSNALLLASGPIMALHALKHHSQPSFFTFEQRLRSWGKALADALDASNTFDMRMAAARALASFATALRPEDAMGSDAAYLPLLLALYSALVDDDEEVRDVGAAATAFVVSKDEATPRPLVAVDAADALLAWLRRRFGRTNEFRAYAACRLVGDTVVAVDVGVQDLAAWTPPEVEFAEALTVDESLFAVEEQNLFVDEVRETERWAGLFGDLEWEWDEIEREDGTFARVLMVDSSLSALRSWTRGALECLAGQVARGDDGPLGWASGPDAFALCHRVLVCGRVLFALLGAEDEGITTLLAQIRESGRSSRLHGLLLSTLGDEADGAKEA